MKQINLIGGPFQHAYSSVWWKKPKEIEWLKNQYISDISFYVDNDIKIGVNDNKPQRKFAWLNESRQFHNMTDWIIYNKEKIEQNYELLFTHDDNISKLSEKFIFIPGNGFWIETPKVYNKTKLLSMITSVKNQTIGHKKRHQIMSKFASKMDLFGRGIKDIKLKEEGLSDYMFSFAIENDNYDTYFSEKILDCFATGTIPIYWGTKNISKYFDSNGIIFYDDKFDISMLSKEFYLSKLESIKYNYEKVLEIEIPEDYIFKNFINI